MKLNYLKDFIEASKNPNMRKTAESLKIAPSVLSKHIKTIELELGVSLFTNSRKNILTPYGKVFLPYAIEIINLEDDYFLRQNDSDAVSKKKITIAMSQIQTRELSGTVLENFSYLNKNINVEKIEISNSDAIDYVINGKCDFAFYRSHASVSRNKDIKFIPISTSSVCVHIPISNPLSSKASVSLEDLKNETIYLRSSSSTIYKMLVEEFHKINIEPKIILASEHIAYEKIKDGEGITIYLSKLSNTEYSKQIKIIPVKPEIIYYTDLIFQNKALSSEGMIFLEYIFRQFVINLK